MGECLVAAGQHPGPEVEGSLDKCNVVSVKYEHNVP